MMLPLILLLLIINLSVNSAIGPIVSTRYGPIVGTTGSYIVNGSKDNYQAFLGIPFAEPPLGDKRFQVPVPFNSTWILPYNATYFRDACVQNPSSEVNVPISENCLYLNVWRPEPGPSDQLLPVYYHSHGAAFFKNSGAKPDYQGDVLAATQKIIFVNSNYRLGVFGFGYGSPDGMPGNAGIYDTLLALRWIQENIQTFGGDPRRVTLTGLSSGGKIATIISSLPKEFNSRSLFSRAIMMSGSSTSKQQVESPEVGAAKTRLLASETGCLSESDKLAQPGSELSAATINCLKEKPADVLLKAQNSKKINAIGAAAEYSFLPVYGTKLIPNPAMVNHIDNLANSANIPMLFGFEQDEKKPFPSLQAVESFQGAYNFTQQEVKFAFKNVSDSLIDYIFHVYFDEVDPTNIHDLKARCVQLTSDVNFNCPSLILSELFSLVSENVYLYQNAYSGQKLSRPFGTEHTDDTLFGQGAPYREPDNYTSSDRQYSSMLMKIYGDFVKGIPLTDWSPVQLNKSDPGALQPIKRLSLTPVNDFDRNQINCMGWARVFNYQIPMHDIRP